ncbi:hypothetical protein [Thalassotalea sp. ND16A]|uniref:hypothetical protein n=1 Tax=Thalassotalea sp. ND16A TaxID=1535422 RepID=UPI00051A35B0|nr:hypothetical protein [Thalassotalea sp. ND16A]KGJ98565.1 hypothetical protein ND16A_0635 [Thalassotalea sp. ND16A]
MEEIVEGFGRGIFRIIKWILIDAFVEFFLYGYGYVSLKIATFGKYPKPGRDNETLCIVTGLISVAVTIVLIIWFGSI